MTKRLCEITTAAQPELPTELWELIGALLAQQGSPALWALRLCSHQTRRATAHWRPRLDFVVECRPCGRQTPWHACTQGCLIDVAVTPCPTEYDPSRHTRILRRRCFKIAQTPRQYRILLRGAEVLWTGKDYGAYQPLMYWSGANGATPQQLVLPSTAFRLVPVGGVHSVALAWEDVRTPPHLRSATL